MDFLGIVFGVFLGMLYCFMAVVLFLPHAGQDRESGFSLNMNVGSDPLLRPGEPQAHPPSAHQLFLYPMRELVAIRATYGLSDDNVRRPLEQESEAVAIHRLARGLPVYGEKQELLRGHYLDVVSR